MSADIHSPNSIRKNKHFRSSVFGPPTPKATDQSVVATRLWGKGESSRNDSQAIIVLPNESGMIHPR